MIDFIKGEGGGNDFILIFHREGLDYREMAIKILKRRINIGGDGLIVMNGRKMRFFNPDGSEVPFCGNGSRVFFYLLYLKGILNKNDEILTGTGPVKLEYSGDRNVTIYMPEIEKGETAEQGLILYCGVPHLLIERDRIDNIDIETSGAELSSILPEGNNVDWFEYKNGEILIRTYERGVNGETLSCASGIAAVSFYFMNRENTDRIKVSTSGGDFEIERVKNNDKRVKLKGKVNLLYKGTIPEKEDSWKKII